MDEAMPEAQRPRMGLPTGTLVVTAGTWAKVFCFPVQDFVFYAVLLPDHDISWYVFGNVSDQTAPSLYRSSAQLCGEWRSPPGTQRCLVRPRWARSSGVEREGALSAPRQGDSLPLLRK